MSGIFAYQPVLELILINAVLAYSQYIVLRTGVFSLGTAAFAAIGAYTAAILVVDHGLPWPLALIVASVLGLVAGALISVPLSRLRGVYQAIATLAFVQIVLSLALYFEELTGGAMGMNGIPRVLSLGQLLLLFGLVGAFILALSSTGLGRVFDAIRQEETVAVSLGIRVTDYQRIAFLISGALGGLAGGMMALRNYSLVPEDFGFPMVIAVLTYVVLGGRVSPLGALAGAAVLTILPEIARQLSDYRMLLNGLVMMLVTIFYPHGLADGLRLWLQRRRRDAQSLQAEGA